MKPLIFLKVSWKACFWMRNLKSSYKNFQLFSLCLQVDWYFLACFFHCHREFVSNFSKSSLCKPYSLSNFCSISTWVVHCYCIEDSVCYICGYKHCSLRSNSLDACVLSFDLIFSFTIIKFAMNGHLIKFCNAVNFISCRFLDSSNFITRTRAASCNTKQNSKIKFSSRTKPKFTECKSKRL